MTPAELVNYYVELLIVQFILLPKAAATVGAFVSQLVASGIISQVRDAFNLDTAVGAQLDMLGTYRGVRRQIYGLDVIKTYWSMVPTTEPTPGDFLGLALTADAPDIGWYWLRASDLNAPSYVMNDGEYRQVLKFMAAVQSSEYTLETLDEILVTFFGTYVTLTDNGDMSITYTHDGTDPNLIFKFVHELGLLPKPAGVSVSVVEV